MPPRKGRNPSAPSDLHKVLNAQINKSSSWRDAIDSICLYFCLPNLETKNGLKHFYKNFDVLSENLMDAFEASGNARVRGGITGVWGKLSEDKLLRDKLVKQGILDRITILLETPETVTIALQTLANITKLGGADTHMEVAKTATEPLVKLLQGNTSDLSIANLTIVILSHTIPSIYLEIEPIYKKYPSIRFKDILPPLNTALLDEHCTALTYRHGRSIVIAATRHEYSTLMAHLPSLYFMVGCLRDPTLAVRGGAMIGIMTCHIHESKQDIRYADPRIRVEGMKRIPSECTPLILSYDSERLDTFLTFKAMGEFTRAQRIAAQTKDFYTLGKKIAQTIMTAELGIGDGFFLDEQGQTVDINLPYATYFGSFPVASAALRRHGSPEDLDMADIIDIKSSMTARAHARTREIVDKAIARNPHHAYWYYGGALSCIDDTTLKWSKRGLKCKITSPFLRYRFLQLAANDAALTGFEKLEGALHGSAELTLGTAYLQSALADATTFIEEAPPDNWSMREMLVVAILTSLVLRGDKISPDLAEINDLMGKHHKIEKIGLELFGPPPKTQMRLVFQTVMQNYKPAANTWDEKLRRWHESGSSLTSANFETPSNASIDDFSAWFEQLPLEHVQNGHKHGLGCYHYVPYGDGPGVALHQCSYCRNPSAALRKCSNCSKARYCDATCQKSDWKKHKFICQSAGKNKTSA